ncbi:MAG: phosphotyrosine protein phosphatase [Clostridiales bacterium]|nr:phosphotyrosine protein phosphatase [Clostridiales bacterium]
MVIRYKKLIFVDTNDKCRAPMAELILKRKFLTNPLPIESRGMVVLFPEPMNPKAEAVLENNGYPKPSHTAEQLEQEDINGDVLLLTMEDRQKSQIWETYENAPHVYTLKEYVGETGDIPALDGQPLSVYSQCYTEMELLMRRLVARLNEEEEL